MNENLNLVEILKDCPKGTKLYSLIYGDVELMNVSQGKDEIYPIEIKLSNNSSGCFTKDGRLYAVHSGECILFPSREERDWSKFKVKKPKFDPKKLQPFDKVLVRDDRNEKWQCSLFSYININDDIYYPSVAINTGYKCCIPYNEETKHLIGTKDEAPECYRYWKD